MSGMSFFKLKCKNLISCPAAGSHAASFGVERNSTNGSPSGMAHHLTWNGSCLVLCAAAPPSSHQQSSTDHKYPKKRAKPTAWWPTTHTHTFLMTSLVSGIWTPRLTISHMIYIWGDTRAAGAGAYNWLFTLQKVLLLSILRGHAIVYP